MPLSDLRHRERDFNQIGHWHSMADASPVAKNCLIGLDVHELGN